MGRTPTTVSGMAVHHDSLADDSWIGAETPLKQGVTEDDDVFVRIGEETSGGGLYAGYGPEVARYLGYHLSIRGIAEGDRLVVEFISSTFLSKDCA